MNKLASLLLLFTFLVSCQNDSKQTTSENVSLQITLPDTTQMPDGPFGEHVKLGRELMLHTSVLIGPNGTLGSYTANKMNCTNCHQWAGTKPFSYNLMRSFERYPQYRAREDRVLSLADRVNNCIMRPHSGKPLPLGSKEMLAFLSYLKWINAPIIKKDSVPGEVNLGLVYPNRAASPALGQTLYQKHCMSCHGANGEGVMMGDSSSYFYPPLWGKYGYQPGSSMHRVTKLASWLKANMPHEKATWFKPILTDEEALDIAAFVNDDTQHQRPNPKNFDYPNPQTKPFDYGIGPFADSFPASQHKFGPFQPIIDFHKKK